MESTELVLKKMGDYVKDWKSCEDRRYIFLSCYHLMSGNMVNAIEGGEFHDPKWVRELLDRFAQYYFENLSCYDCGDRPSKVWEHTHNATKNNDLNELQYLVLGVNAHINYDLVLALYDMLVSEWDELPDSIRRQRYEDHCQVNDVIARTIDRVQDEILEPTNPTLDWLDKLFGRMDEYLISRLIISWRGDVWDRTQKLLQMESEEKREAFRKELEQDVLQRAKVISFF